MSELREEGRTISTATAAKLRAAVDALQELLAMAEAETPTSPDNDLAEVIKHKGDKWVLYSADGSKELGEFDTEDEAKRREREIQFFKHKEAAPFEEAEGVKFVIGFKKGGGSEVQTVIFNKEKWTVEKARKWLADNDMKVSAVDETEDSLRFRQADPADYIRFRTIEPKESRSNVALAEEYIELIERAIGDDGIAPIRLIKPGWGSSGYYPANVLRRDGPLVFRRGMQMHFDHQTEREAKERPEGSVRTLVGVLDSDAKWEEGGPVGPGLYADAKVFEQYRSMLNEMAPYIGVSIRASGRATKGEAEGRKGYIVEAIVAANTTDYVTRAGAGGMILPLTESADDDDGVGLTLFKANGRKSEVEANMDELEELRAENARIKEALLLREARDVIIEALVKVDMSEPTRARLTESLAKAPPVVDGMLDVRALQMRCGEVAITELEYLAKASSAGAIKGMGTMATTSVNGGTALREAFKRMYLHQGKMLEEAEKLAANAAMGR